MKRFKNFFNKLIACLDFLIHSGDDAWIVIYNMPKKRSCAYIIDDTIDETDKRLKMLVNSLYADIVLLGEDNKKEDKTNV